MTTQTVTREQRVQILAALEDTERYRGRRDVVSKSSGKTYRIAIRNPDKRWTCSCMGWTRTCNPRGTDCSHIKAVKALCGKEVDVAQLRSSELIQVMKILLEDCATASGDEILSRWLRIQDAALNLLTYYSLCEETTAASEYDILFGKLRVQAIAAATL